MKIAEANVSTVNSSYLDSVFNLLENILNYPYDDDHRILDLEFYSDNKILNSAEFHRLLEDIGFEKGSKSTILVLPHNKELGDVFFALEILISKISSVNVESYIGFPFFQKYSEHLGVDLTVNE